MRTIIIPVTRTITFTIRRVTSLIITITRAELRSVLS